MKDYKEMSDSVLKRVHEYEQQKQKDKSKVRIIGKWSALIIPVLVISAVGIFMLASASSSEIEKDNNAAGSKNDHSEHYETTSSLLESKNDSEISSSSTFSSEVSVSSSALDSSAINPNERVGGQVMIAALPKNNRTQVIGEKITEEEARDYFNKNAASLQSSLIASGVELAEISYEAAEYDFTSNVLCAKGSLMFMKGYCHISYDGNADESKPGLTVKQNFMDFHVYNAGKLVAIVTLVKENSLIYGTPAFEAPWFNSFSNALNKYAGQKVLFLYAGAMAFAIAPDGTVIHPQGYESSVRDSGLDTFPNAYEWFYNEQCVYTP